MILRSERAEVGRNGVNSNIERSGLGPGEKRNKERKYFSEVVLGAQRKGPEL